MIFKNMFITVMGKCVGSGNLVKNIKCTMKDTYAIILSNSKHKLPATMTKTIVKTISVHSIVI